MESFDEVVARVEHEEASTAALRLYEEAWQMIEAQQVLTPAALKLGRKAHEAKLVADRWRRRMRIEVAG